MFFFYFCVFISILDDVSYSQNVNDMNKDILAGMLVGYKERFDSTLSAINDELKELKTNFHKLETDLVISRNVNGKLTQQLSLVEKKMLGKRTILSPGEP